MSPEYITAIQMKTGLLQFYLGLILAFLNKETNQINKCRWKYNHEWQPYGYVKINLILCHSDKF